MKIAFLIYLILCVIYGVTMESAVVISKWEYWIGFACLIGAFLCGKFDKRD